ncbi:hypothetical protein ThvES_00007890 [Thiovulum sp. ES]|nr:hypothetical protein ThvES_00007890 [Thiovulum sp. ES]
MRAIKLGSNTYFVTEEETGRLSKAKRTGDSITRNAVSYSNIELRSRDSVRIDSERVSSNSSVLSVNNYRFTTKLIFRDTRVTQRIPNTEIHLGQENPNTQLIFKEDRAYILAKYSSLIFYPSLKYKTIQLKEVSGG